MYKTNFLSALSFVLFIVSKQSLQYQIPSKILLYELMSLFLNKFFCKNSSYLATILTYKRRLHLKASLLKRREESQRKDSFLILTNQLMQTKKTRKTPC